MMIPLKHHETEYQDLSATDVQKNNRPLLKEQGWLRQQLIPATHEEATFSGVLIGLFLVVSYFAVVWAATHI